MSAEPAKDYDNLVRQFNAMKTLIHSMEQTLSYYRKKDYSVSEARLIALEAALESEREMNAMLTKELNSTTE